MNEDSVHDKDYDEVYILQNINGKLDHLEYTAKTLHEINKNIEAGIYKLMMK